MECYLQCCGAKAGTAGAATFCWSRSRSFFARLPLCWRNDNPCLAENVLFCITFRYRYWYVVALFWFTRKFIVLCIGTVLGHD
jgi:hypothetical protein